ncbi:phosphopantetheine-binding protein [Salinispora cortesiana]|uniref:phosphopantetheine-binding protein n=1 Tax=Salinispora cortesiana TaxID=1305843 RepID=UPI0009B78803|nr:phosphopantetheine-binding protein [Salinispora cortesiana]
MNELHAEIRRLLLEKMPDIVDELALDSEDIFYAGVAINSFTVVSVVVLLEEHYEITIDSRNFTKDRFASISSIAELVQEYLEGR